MAKDNLGKRHHKVDTKKVKDSKDIDGADDATPLTLEEANTKAKSILSNKDGWSVKIDIVDYNDQDKVVKSYTNKNKQQDSMDKKTKNINVKALKGKVCDKSFPYSTSYKDALKNAKLSAERDGYDQQILLGKDGDFSFTRSYDETLIDGVNKYGEIVVAIVRVSYKNGCRYSYVDETAKNKYMLENTFSPKERKSTLMTYTSDSQKTKKVMGKVIKDASDDMFEAYKQAKGQGLLGGSSFYSLDDNKRKALADLKKKAKYKYSSANGRDEDESFYNALCKLDKKYGKRFSDSKKVKDGGKYANSKKTLSMEWRVQESFGMVNGQTQR